MSRQIQIRRGTTAENDAFTGAEGEITVDLTKKTLRVHDGSTQGGTELAKSSDIYTQTEIDDLLSGKSSTDLSNITATGKETIAHLAMPNFTHKTSITAGATGIQYTAPADGYYHCVGVSSAVGGELVLGSDFLSTGVAAGSNFYRDTAYKTGQILTVFILVKKGEPIRLYYQNMEIRQFQFIYAQGAQ